jgi:PPOX class probable FMN-dependent enzyme
MRTTITDAAQLREIIGTPLPRAVQKDRDRLHPEHLAFLAASPFCLVSTSASDGTCDVSPKGDPAGFIHVVDDRTLALPERPGNRRADGYLNVLDNPHVGLLFIVPGRGDTLRVNGRATLLCRVRSPRPPTRPSRPAGPEPRHPASSWSSPPGRTPRWT